MSKVAAQKSNPIEWGVAARPIAGEAISGDLHLVKPFDHGVLLAVVDGVGHGDEATAAARLAVDILGKHAHESVISLVKRCHQSLTRSRGVVMTVASLNARENTVTWLGVGNVEGLLLRADENASHQTESVLQRSGLVGYQLPALHASVIPVTPGDLLVFVTDGIHSGFVEDINLNSVPKQLAEHILCRHLKGNDDALVLVVRYLGALHE